MLVDTDVLIDLANNDTIAKTRLKSESQHTDLVISTISTIAQPTMQPACVLRSNNWSVLEQKGLISSKEINECKNRMNTFGFVGALEGTPSIDCIYQNDAAKNLFLERGGDTPPETERF